MIPLQVGNERIGLVKLGDPRRGLFSVERIALYERFASYIAVAYAKFRADDAVRLSEKKYRALIENVHIGVGVVDSAGKITFVNRTLADMLGYTREEMVGANFLSFVDEKKKETTNHHFLSHKAGIATRYESVVNRKDGGKLSVDIGGSSLLDDEGRVIGALAFFTDLTEKKRLEVCLRQSQRLEAVGSLTGQIAHEFKNLLMAISGYVEVLQMNLGSDHPELALTDDILHCVDRSSRLISQLIAFSRKQPMDQQPLDLNRLVQGSRNLLEILIGEHIPIELKLSPDPGIIDADPGQIEQVLVNLAINAHDAMPNGGRLTIATRILTPAEAHLLQQGSPESDGFIELTVSDTGVGMDEVILEHLFDPFFTTKSKQDRSGLGLAVVYGVVKQHKGSISASSRVGMGTTFHLYFPLTKGVPKEELRSIAAKPKPGCETILLAED